MLEDVSVRPAGEEGLQAAADMAYQLLLQAASGWPPSQRRALGPDARGSWLEEWREAIAGDRGQVFVAVAGDTVVGFLSVGLREQPGTYAHRVVARVGHVSVEEHRHGEGIAGRLMYQASRWALEHGTTVLTLVTPFHNVAARYVWEALGFEEQDVVMEKTIPENLPPYRAEPQPSRALRLPP